ncbi:hypothetical protein AWW66_22875 [Micromonospora rosaria]|uniref:ABC transporter domain-containing protein n=1 Tax=Micromonospora rosaria TaxID=47874 RepID=A0A136PMN9_9ACTN|nr:ATP-binding cassette domain-containing protein [Micromonospora rosaria]KXK59683.1 hypothetical protein AWW66_22875 [Micromonospora rosaria]
MGVNGAGKTTMAALLAGLYHPSSGRITVDGTDLADLDPVTWRARVCAVFRDFVRYPLTVRDHVTLGGTRTAGSIL